MVNADYRQKFEDIKSLDYKQKSVEIKDKMMSYFKSKTPEPEIEFT